MPKSKPKKPTVIVLKSKKQAPIVVKPKKKAAIVVQPKKPDAIVVQPITMPVKEDLAKDSTKKDEEEFVGPTYNIQKHSRISWKYFLKYFRSIIKNSMQKRSPTQSNLSRAVQMYLLWK